MACDGMVRCVRIDLFLVLFLLRFASVGLIQALDLEGAHGRYFSTRLSIRILRFYLSFVTGRLG